MNAETYRFRVGNFRCMAVSDGTFTYAPPILPPPDVFLFANAPAERLERALDEHNLVRGEWGAWISPYVCLLIDTGEHLVLVDTGAGGLGPNTGRLLRNLHIEGITPGDIDAVILTHGHPDHLGGNTDAEGKLVFPRAWYAMRKDEWQFWTSEQAARRLVGHGMDVLDLARKNLLAIQGRIGLIDKETEVLPGISAIAAPCHTPGHTALAISSGGEQLLCISDTVLHPIHLAEPAWHAAVDIVPDLVPATRRRLLKKAADEKALVIAFHFPFPGLGHVLPKGKAWQWQPI